MKTNPRPTSRDGLPFHFRLTPVVLELMKLEAAEARALVERCGLPIKAVTGPCTAPLRCVCDLLDAAQAKLGATFPLLLAEAAPAGTYEAAEIVVRTAPTLGEGLVGLARFAGLINPIGRFEYADGDPVELHYSVAGRRDCLGEALNVFTMAYLVRALRSVGLPADALRATWFAHGETKARAQLREYFGCPITLGAPTCGFALAPMIAALPLRTSDSVTHGYLRKHAEERLAAVGEGTIAALVADEIRKEVSLRGVDLARIAKRLGLSERTAQRRLAGEGTSFTAVLDHVRERIAEGLVLTGLPSSRIAETLGFADVRTFRRAIARWEAGAR